VAHSVDTQALERLYAHYNRRKFVHPDPLEFLYRYDDVRDREVAGLVASSLAYGRVGQILKSVAKVLDRMSGRPATFLERASATRLRRTFAGFTHRFTSGEDVARLLCGVKRVMKRCGSLEACFAAGMTDADETVQPALGSFVGELAEGAGTRPASLLPDPAKGSACKRLHLFLRWMVRRDAVDPGGWEHVAPSKLVVPLDTHMFRLCRGFEFTRRRQADARTALEVTARFRELAPDDPVRYDFALTRLGIRNDADADAFLSPRATTKVMRRRTPA
jgi:uncharacterized protein (TIGR02757 family)